MYRPTFAVDAIGRDEPKALEIGLEAMGFLLEALVKIDRAHLRRFPNTPRLYKSGVRYDAMEPPEGSACGDDDWSDVVRVLETKGPKGNPIGDCEELSAWRVAELQEFWGINAAPHVFLRRDWVKDENGNHQRRHLYHIVVKWPEGLRRYPRTVKRMADGLLIEDPSRVLGM